MMKARNLPVQAESLVRAQLVKITVIMDCITFWICHPLLDESACDAALQLAVQAASDIQQNLGALPQNGHLILQGEKMMPCDAQEVDVLAVPAIA